MMEGFWLSWLMLVGVFGAVLIAPGPDFMVAVRNSLTHGRRAGIFTALGFSVGAMLHGTYSIFGMAALIAHSLFWFKLLQYAGAAYLFYIGIRALRSKAAHPNLGLDTPKAPTLGAGAAFLSGLVTNLLNPKAVLFFLALFTQVIDPAMPLPQQALLVFTCSCMTALWFVFVACVLTAGRMRAAFLRFSRAIDRACGALFIGAGLKLLFSPAAK